MGRLGQLLPDVLRCRPSGNSLCRSLACFLVANIRIFPGCLQLFSPDLLPLRFCQPMTAIAIIAATTTASTDIF